MFKILSSLFKLQILFICSLNLVNLNNVFATSAPIAGLLYNTNEIHSLSYNCNQINNNTIDCNFSQTMIIKKSTPNNLENIQKDARAEFNNGVNISDGDCKMYSQFLDILEGRINPPKENAIEKLSAIEKKDLLDSARAMNEYCDTRELQEFLKVVRLTHEKETRTCKVSSNTFKQSFQLVRDSLSNEGIWVVKASPEGPCGIIQLSRFEPEIMNNSKVVFWKFIAKKTITNPNGQLFPGSSCRKLDEKEYIYDWRSKEHAVRCDYIEFSPM